MLSVEKFRFAVDALHNPGKLIWVHPRTDMREEFGGTGFNVFISYILQAQCVCIPIIVDLANGCRQSFIHIFFTLFGWFYTSKCQLYPSKQIHLRLVIQ